MHEFFEYNDKINNAENDYPYVRLCILLDNSSRRLINTETKNEDDGKFPCADIATLIERLKNHKIYDDCCIKSISCTRKYSSCPSNRGPGYFFTLTRLAKNLCKCENNEKCMENISCGKCKCPNIINTFGNALFPMQYKNK